MFIFFLSKNESSAVKGGTRLYSELIKVRDVKNLLRF
jgi:hypothetical protein